MTLLRRMSWLSLVLGFGHVVFGAIVRITGSGMGCGDHWPKCQGLWFPPLDRVDLVIEISHRYFAATLTTSIVALLLVAWMRREVRGVGGRDGLLRPVALAAGLVVTAALFGGFTVWLKLASKGVIVTHLALAMGLLAALVVAILRAGGPPLIPRYVAPTADPSPVPRIPNPSVAGWTASPASARDTRLAAALVFIAVVLGGLTAHVPGANVSCAGFPLCGGRLVPNDPSQYLQFTHRLVAFASFFWVGWLGVAHTRRGERRLAAGARLVLTVLFLQVIVAATMILANMPPLWRSLHEAVGTAAWIVSFAWAYVAHRLASGAAPTRDGAEPVSANASATPGARMGARA